AAPQPTAPPAREPAGEARGTVTPLAFSRRPAPSKTDRRREARARGYEGDPCTECGNLTLVRNGTCMKCDTCGSTSGCS
ncbi:MAG: hypothetical protein GVY13_17410, partial [Alphaproteobacteria bacterium]|nr:hypothetical protein [Alphaproteobacteria bacterium]